MSRHEMNFRVQVCGWPAGCFNAAGNQLYTPQELERIAQADDRSCPSGVCVPMGHGHNLTGVVSLEDYQRAREAEVDARLAVLRQGVRPERQVLAPDVRRLPDGGEWITPAPVDHRSWIEVLLGFGR